MSKHFLKNILLAVALFATPSAFAQTWDAGGDGTSWSDANNWTPTTVPNAAGATATLTFPGGNFGAALNVNLLTTSETVGILNVGTSDGTAGGTYNLTSSGGTLTLNNSGAGAQINEISTAVGDTIGAPIIVSDAGGLTITNSATSTSSTFQINGGITSTGTGNVTITNNSGNTGNAVVTGNSSQINNTGTLTINGTGTGTVRFQGGVGSNVTQITNSGATHLMFAGAGITVNSAGTTLINSGAGGISADGGTGPTGTGNFTFNNNGSGNAQIGAVNNVGELILNGTFNNSGNDTQTQVGPVGSNVTEVLQESAVTAVGLRNGAFTVNAAGTFLVNTGGASLALKQNAIGTGDIIMQNDTSVGGAVSIAEQTINNTGKVINSGTGSGESSISTGLGANVTAVIENSATSALEFRNAGTTFTGIWTVQTGAMIFSGGDGNFTDGSILVGDTAAHGAASFLQLNIDGGTFTMGSSQALRGFGSVTSQNVATVAGSAIAPGTTGNIGKLTINSGLSLATGTNLTFALGTATGTPGTSTSSQLAIGNTLTLASGLNLDLLDNAGANGQGSLGVGEYELFTYGSLSGASAGDITSLFDITGPSGFTYSVIDTGTGAGQIDLDVIAAAPEPGTWAMMLGGLGLLFGMQRLRSRRA